jgi:hypothetical protein
MEIKKLVPHFFMENIITEENRTYILNFINKQKNIDKIIGGTQVIKKENISDDKVLDILNDMVLYFEKNIFEFFADYLPIKINEIETRTNRIISNFNTDVYGPFISICEPGHFINAHRDDFFQFIICIIYLGHLDNTPAQTTSILNGQEILSANSENDIIHTENYGNIDRINFGYSNNSALFFLNNDYAYHMVDNPIEKNRATIMFSIEIRINEN